MDASHEKIDAAHNTVSRLIELDLRSLLAEEGLREFSANLDYLRSVDFFPPHVNGPVEELLLGFSPYVDTLGLQLQALDTPTSFLEAFSENERIMEEGPQAYEVLSAEIQKLDQEIEGKLLAAKAKKISLAKEIRNLSQRTKEATAAYEYALPQFQSQKQDKPNRAAERMWERARNVLRENQ